MEMITAIMHGSFLTLGLILPLGVQNVFIFNQGSSQRLFWHALPSILTAASCDTLMIVASIMGLSVLLMQHEMLKIGMMVVGSFFLLYMGFVLWNQTARSKHQKAIPLSWQKQILFAASVSLLNPHAILDIIMVIGTNALPYASSTKIAYTMSCITVTWIWFFALGLSARMVSRYDQKGMVTFYINKCAALIVWVISAHFFYDLVMIWYKKY